MVRRLKSEIRDWDRLCPRFQERKVDVLPVVYPQPERDLHADLAAYGRSRGGRAAALGESGRTAAEFVLLLLKKRLFSSPAAFARTLATHRETLAGGRRPALAPTASVLRQAIDAAEEDFADEDAQQAATEDALVTAAGFAETLTAEERRLLDRMASWAEQAAAKGDAKLAELIRFLESVILAPGPDGRPAWTDERVIVFTEYRDTQRWLHEQLASRLDGEPVCTSMAGLQASVALAPGEPGGVIYGRRRATQPGNALPLGPLVEGLAARKAPDHPSIATFMRPKGRNGAGTSTAGARWHRCARSPATPPR